MAIGIDFSLDFFLFHFLNIIMNNNNNNNGVNLEVATSAVIVMKLIVPTRNTRFLPILPNSAYSSSTDEGRIPRNTVY